MDSLGYDNKRKFNEIQADQISTKRLKVGLAYSLPETGPSEAGQVIQSVGTGPLAELEWAVPQGGGGGGVTDHTLLTNIGTTTHASLDAFKLDTESKLGQAVNPSSTVEFAEVVTPAISNDGNIKLDNQNAVSGVHSVNIDAGDSINMTAHAGGANVVALGNVLHTSVAGNVALNAQAGALSLEGTQDVFITSNGGPVAINAMGGGSTLGGTTGVVLNSGSGSVQVKSLDAGYLLPRTAPVAGQVITALGPADTTWQTPSPFADQGLDSTDDATFRSLKIDPAADSSVITLNRPASPDASKVVFSTADAVDWEFGTLDGTQLALRNGAGDTAFVVEQQSNNVIMENALYVDNIQSITNDLTVRTSSMTVKRPFTGDAVLNVSSEGVDTDASVVLQDNGADAWTLKHQSASGNLTLRSDILGTDILTLFDSAQAVAVDATVLVGDTQDVRWFSNGDQGLFDDAATFRVQSDKTVVLRSVANNVDLAAESPTGQINVTANATVGVTSVSADVSVSAPAGKVVLDGGSVRIGATAGSDWILPAARGVDAQYLTQGAGGQAAWSDLPVRDYMNAYSNYPIIIGAAPTFDTSATPQQAIWFVLTLPNLALSGIQSGAFTLTNGAIIYTGTTTKQFHFTHTITWQANGGSDDYYSLAVAVSGVTPVQSITSSDIDNTRQYPLTSSGNCIITVAPGDNLRPVVRNNQGTQGVNVYTYQMSLMEV